MQLEQEFKMKILTRLLSVCLIGFFTANVIAQVLPFSASAYNWENNPSNFNNSPYNWQNSSYNYENSNNNFNAKNGLYDNKGNRIGYEVQAPTGVTNFFDNSGNRIGYTPAKR